MKPVKKMSYLLLVLGMTTLIATRITPGDGWSGLADSPILKKVLQKLELFNAERPEERLYLHIDKPLYEPGDDIWLSGYVRDGITLAPSEISDIVHVELINPRGGVEKKISLITRNGKVSGDFSLDREAVGGLYKIKAYTSWMKNDGEENCFIKEIQVQEVILPALKMQLDFEKKSFGPGDRVIAKLSLQTNENKPLHAHSFKVLATVNGQKVADVSASTDAEGLGYFQFLLPAKLTGNDGLLNAMIEYNGSTESISRSIPIVLNKVRVNLYPEGGDLLEGHECRVAFRAVNEFGKPVDIEGLIMSSKGSRIAAVSSFHQGMGTFRINPQPGEKYFLQITRPAGIAQQFALPEPLERGYAMGVTRTADDELCVTVSTSETEELALIAQVRGRVCYSNAFAVMPGTNEVRFSTKDFPAGVAQLTLFDSKGIARAERLAFVNKHKQMRISVMPEKEKYLPREKVRLTISVKDERGLPMPAFLSMAVVNDQLLSFADDRSGNIVSELLLQQDLREKVEEPSFYFKPGEKKSDAALDHLLLTSGWRRFTWERVMKNQQEPVMFAAQKALISGIVIDGNTRTPLANARLKHSDGQLTVTDMNGRFLIRGKDLSKPFTLTCEMPGFQPTTQMIRDYVQEMQVYMYTNHYMRRDMLHHRQPVQMAMEQEAFLPPSAAEMVHEVAPQLEKHGMKVAGKAATGNKREAAADIAAKEMKVADARFNKKGVVVFDDQMAHPVAQQNLYYRAREFFGPVYEKQPSPEQRTDFRNTIYWNPDIEVGFSGKKTIEFYASDDITSYRVVTEAAGSDGSIGRSESVLYTQLPFEMITKIPGELITGDVISVPVTLRNNTTGPLGGLLTAQAPAGLRSASSHTSVQTIMPGKAKTVYLDYTVLDVPGEAPFTVTFRACALSDAVTQNIKIVPKGFPVQLSFSGSELQKEYSFEIGHLVPGSLKASFTAFPNVVTDLMKGVEGILQEPYGCFEQTSCTAYPNAMVLDYLKHTGSQDTKVLAHATQLLDRGYKRLTTFESPGKGYEWFGANPAHEGLTAYGIMEFVDMKNAGQNVDEVMLDRTARWLLNHKDGKGGFEREQRALHDFGRISDEVMNAYIVYALAESGYTDINREFEQTYQKAMGTRDNYLVALAANAAFTLKETQKAHSLLKLLFSAQAANGSINGSSHSITYSQGNSLMIETTALSLLAMLKAGSPDAAALSRAVQFLVSSRSGSGVFSSTQGTILALKALTAYAKFNKQVAANGTIFIYIDGAMVAQKSYNAGEKGNISVDGLERYIRSDGKHTVTVKFAGTKQALPYSMAVNWNTTLPSDDRQCDIHLKTAMSSGAARVGHTVRMSAVIKNSRNSDVPSTMLILGIPAGLSVQPWQLKELQEKKVFDYYEIKGNNLAIYYRGLGALSEKDINLDLKAELPGKFEAPAACAYLYYTNEFKRWASAGKISITQ